MANQEGAQVVVETHDLYKRYPGTTALAAVDYRVYGGRVNCLIGENGAGKSTLMKILAGAETPSEGYVSVKGEPVHLDSVAAAERAGIGIVFQELNLFPDLSVAENIFIGHEPKRLGLITAKEQKRRAAEQLKRLGLDIDPDTRLGDLYVGQQQLVEIAKALIKNVDVLIMDEPTSALSQTEVDVLFEVVRALRAEGLAIIYISHRLEEVVGLGDHITVLRNGEKVAEDLIANIDIPWIVSAMVGGSAGAFDNQPGSGYPPNFEVRDLTLKRTNGLYALDHVSFQAGRGEVIGIYGLMGAGRTELVETIYGIARNASGQIVLDGADLSRSSAIKRLKAGISLVPEDRQTAGMIQGMSVRENMSLSSLSRYAWSRLMPWIQRRREQADAEDMIAWLRVKCASAAVPMTSLSGGNMQKVVIAKALLTKPKVMLFDEPTRGVDVGAKTEIYKAMKAIADEGVTVIYTTSELDEALAVSDRIIVMSTGRITADLPRTDATRDRIVECSAPTAGTAESLIS
ncbi:sugar ABC transporter ATP-binding protein [Salinisphaera sp. SPP-AMP-43]|uniref:sugar ABC transporter ATP-binding protein n=1 Tax=Salinisphaera sp. SPP-AMP-43 TaxID=3121288 RepID=UPI003C6DE2A7